MSSAAAKAQRKPAAPEDGIESYLEIVMRDVERTLATHDGVAILVFTRGPAGPHAKFVNNCAEREMIQPLREIAAHLQRRTGSAGGAGR